MLQACLHPTLTDVPGAGVIALQLLAADDVPDAGHPVCQQCKHGHEQREHHGAVLRVPVQLLQQPQQPQQPHCLQQVNQRGLGGRQEGEPGVASGRDKKRPQHHPQGRNPFPALQLPEESWASQRQLIPSQLCIPVPNTQQAAMVVTCQGTQYPQEMWVLERGREVAAALLLKAVFVPAALTTVTLKM